MKLSKLFSVAILAVSALSMSAQGIEFMPENARLQDALDKAKQVRSLQNDVDQDFPHTGGRRLHEPQIRVNQD